MSEGRSESRGSRTQPSQNAAQNLSDMNNLERNPSAQSNNTQASASRRPSRRRRPTRQHSNTTIREPPQGLSSQTQQPQGWADDDYYQDNPWFGQPNKKPIFSLGAPLPHQPRRRAAPRRRSKKRSESSNDEEGSRANRRKGRSKSKPLSDEEIGHISEASNEEDDDEDGDDDDDEPEGPDRGDTTEGEGDYFSRGDQESTRNVDLTRKATGNSNMSKAEVASQQAQQQRMTSAGVTHGQKYNAAGQPVFDYMPNQSFSPRSGGGEDGRSPHLRRVSTTRNTPGHGSSGGGGGGNEEDRPNDESTKEKKAPGENDEQGQQQGEAQEEDDEDEVVLEKKRSAAAQSQNQQQQQPNYAIDSEPLGQKEDDLVEEGVVDDPDDMRNWWARVRARHPEPLAEFLATTTAIFLGLCGTLSVNLSASQPTKYGTYETCCWAWGFSWMFGIYLGGGVSGAHMNPAISMSLSLFRGFPLRTCSVYVLAQLVAGLAAAGLAYALYADSIHHVDVDPPFSITAKTFFSTPRDWVSPGSGFANQVVGAGIMMMAVLALGDDQNNPPGAGMHALVLGLLVTTLKLTLGYNVGSALNPASDFGPRIVAYAIGVKGADAWSGGWWLYGPWVGAIVGSFLGCVIYDFFVFVGSESPVNYRYAFDGWRTRTDKLRRFVPRF